MVHDSGDLNNTPVPIATAALRSGHAGTFAALQSLPADTDPAIRYAYERLYRAFGHAIHRRTNKMVADISMPWGRRLIASEHSSN